MTNPSPSWLATFTSALDAEYQTRPRIAALATVDSHNRPHVRHVILRRITPDGRLLITSDSRSEKNQHLRRNPHAELALYLPNLRLQFRISGDVEFLSDSNAVLDLWRELTDASRALFFWPTPGSPRDPRADFPLTVASDGPPPVSFDVLALIPSKIDHLDLNPTPHRRLRYRLETGWVAEEINP